MKYFIDTEFIEGFRKPLFGKKRHFIDLISIGIYREDGKFLYLISNEYNFNDADEWVKNNVIMPAYKSYVSGDARNRLDTTNFHKYLGYSNEEIKNKVPGQFVTLTFSNEALKDIADKAETTDPNLQATYAVRHFLERWRKHNTKSVKHWLITELGHNGTERIHLHGIIFTDKPEEIRKHWQYGWVFIGKYVNEQTINYIAKYITKIDTKHPGYQGKILTSPGIGNKYLHKPESKLNTFIPGQTNELYKTRTGSKLPLPIYYRNKLYNDEQRESLWIEKLNKQTRYIMGEKYDISTPEGEKNYFKGLEYYRAKNKRMGYNSIAWNMEIYKNMLKNIKNESTNSHICSETKPKHHEKPYNYAQILESQALPPIYQNSKF